MEETARELRLQARNAARSIAMATPSRSSLATSAANLRRSVSGFASTAVSFFRSTNSTISAHPSTSAPMSPTQVQTPVLPQLSNPLSLPSASSPPAVPTMTTLTAVSVHATPPNASHAHVPATGNLIDLGVPASSAHSEPQAAGRSTASFPQAVSEAATQAAVSVAADQAATPEFTPQAVVSTSSNQTALPVSTTVSPHHVAASASITPSPPSTTPPMPDLQPPPQSMGHTAAQAPVYLPSSVLNYQAAPTVPARDRPALAAHVPVPPTLPHQFPAQGPAQPTAYTPASHFATHAPAPGFRNTPFPWDLALPSAAHTVVAPSGAHPVPSIPTAWPGPFPYSPVPSPLPTAHVHHPPTPPAPSFTGTPTPSHATVQAAATVMVMRQPVTLKPFYGAAGDQQTAEQFVRSVRRFWDADPTLNDISRVDVLLDHLGGLALGEVEAHRDLGSEKCLEVLLRCFGERRDPTTLLVDLVNMRQEEGERIRTYAVRLRKAFTAYVRRQRDCHEPERDDFFLRGRFIDSVRGADLKRALKARVDISPRASFDQVKEWAIEWEECDTEAEEGERSARVGRVQFDDSHLRARIAELEDELAAAKASKNPPATAPPTAPSQRPKATSRPASRHQEHKPARQCHECKSWDHWSYECPKRNNQGRQGNQGNDQGPRRW